MIYYNNSRIAIIQFGANSTKNFRKNRKTDLIVQSFITKKLFKFNKKRFASSVGQMNMKFIEVTRTPMPTTIAVTLQLYHSDCDSYN